MPLLHAGQSERGSNVPLKPVGMSGKNYDGAEDYSSVVVSWKREDNQRLSRSSPHIREVWTGPPQCPVCMIST